MLEVAVVAVAGTIGAGAGLIEAVAGAIVAIFLFSFFVSFAEKRMG